MSGNSNKPGGNKTVQTLLQAKKDKGKEKPPKRPITEVSMDSSCELDLSNLQGDLEFIKDSLENVVKKPDLDNALNDIVKKSDLETIVTTIVNKLVDNMKQEIDQKLFEMTSKQTAAIEQLTRENEDLRELIANQRKQISDLEIRVVDNELRSKEALQMSNYNQQYSRKFNIKVMNYPEKKDENLREIFVKDIVKEKLGVEILESQIQAIHRIPGKEGERKPVLVKLVNSEVKHGIMRCKKNLPDKTEFKLVDDVTKTNMALITCLRNSDKLESVWYFNCGVYGKTKSGRRIKFDIFDDINAKVK